MGRESGGPDSRRLSPRMAMTMKPALDYLREDNGAALAEYALILAVIGAALAASMLFLGESVAASVNHAASCVKAGKAC